MKSIASEPVGCFRACKRKNGRIDLLPPETQPALLISD